jgi:hypothetical protein
VRQKLKRAITRNFVPDGKARVITINPEAEKALSGASVRRDKGSNVAMEPRAAAAFSVESEKGGGSFPQPWRITHGDYVAADPQAGEKPVPAGISGSGGAVL